MGLISKNLIYFIAGVLALTLGTLLVFCLKQNMQISSLKSKNKELVILNDELQIDKATLKANLTLAQMATTKQNEAIKRMSVNVNTKPSFKQEQIRKIYIKDKSCEAELRAYKELFR